MVARCQNSQAGEKPKGKKISFEQVQMSLLHFLEPSHLVDGVTHSCLPTCGALGHLKRYCCLGRHCTMCILCTSLTKCPNFDIKEIQYLLTVNSGISHALIGTMYGAIETLGLGTTDPSTHWRDRMKAYLGI